MRGTFSLRYVLFTLVLAVFAYLYALDSRFAPKNGDEYPYMHIVRMTAEAGHWLPLQSQMEGLKNTKPPLIFWQGIAATNWANDWHLFNLRWPSILYTGLTAFFLFLAVRRFSGNTQAGVLSALVWLSFFATYRYGRPFLTDPPEVFWVNLPFLMLLYWGRAAYESKFFFPAAAGICIGLALLAKSFAYIVPACLALGIFYWHWRNWNIPKVLINDFYKLVLVAALALSIFGLWFALDPYPEAIWREFVLGENAGKFASRNTHYLADLLWGDDSIWMLLVTTMANAGLFTFVLLSTLLQCWKERRFLSSQEILLFCMIATFLVVFSLPSQRSGRYLLPVMPAFAVLIALHWQRLPLWGFWAALFLQGVVLGVLIWLGLNLQAAQIISDAGVWSYQPWHWMLMALSMLIVLIGLINKKQTKATALIGCFLTYCALSSSLSPLEGKLGQFSAQTIAQLEGKDVWIPCDYRAKDEEYRLLLPGAQLHGYLAKDAANVADLTQSYPLVAVHTPLGTKPSICESCQVMGQRMEMRARHTDQEIEEMLLGKVAEHLFVTETLVATPRSISLASDMKDACR